MTEVDPFAPAQKIAAKAKIAVVGVAGSGKTYTALLIARGLAGPGGSIAVADAEGGSSQTYADEFEFGVVTMTAPFTAQKLRKTINAAVKHGKSVLLIDGISPWWSQVKKLADDNSKGDASGGWKTARPEQKEIEALVDTCPIHLICTVRAKQDTQIQTVNGKLRPVKLGMKADMAEEMAYVFGFIFSVEHEDHSLTVDKTRWSEIDRGSILANIGEDVQPAEQMAIDMRAWLEAGVDAEPAPQPAAPEPAPSAPAPVPAPEPAAPAATPAPATPAGAAPEIAPSAEQPEAQPPRAPASEPAAPAAPTRGQVESDLRAELVKTEVRTLVVQACKELGIEWGPFTPGEIMTRFYGPGRTAVDVVGALLTAGTPKVPGGPPTPMGEGEPPFGGDA